jgi:hypothetical protein
MKNKFVKELNHGYLLSCISLYYLLLLIISSGPSYLLLSKSLRHSAEVNINLGYFITKIHA